MTKVNRAASRALLCAAALASSSVLGFVLTGCGGDTSSAAAAPLPIDEFIAKFVPTICALRVRCGVAPDVEACVDANHSSAFDLLQARADLAAGKTTYDGAAAGACLAAISKESCQSSEQSGAAEEICRGAFRGTIAEGVTCVNDFQCTSGYCATSCDPRDYCCTGTCGPKRQIVAVDGKCGTPAMRCGADAYCQHISADEARCFPRQADGQRCQEDRVCRQGSSCRRTSVSSPDGTCAKMAVEGEACDVLPCDGDDIACDPVRLVCTKRVAPGQPCDPGDLAGQCVSYARCDQATSSCVALARLGQPCGDLGACLGDLICGGGTCLAPRDPPICD
jgi:hypothetical protein